jgi:hypothetical protein
LFNRSFALWFLGYPEAALADGDLALKDAREIGQAGTLIYALCWNPRLCGNYATANARCNEAAALAEEKGATLFNAVARLTLGNVLAMTDKASDAVDVITPQWQHIAQREQRCLFRGGCQIWRQPMRHWENSTTLGAASPKRRTSWKQRMKDSSRWKFIVPPMKSH